MFIIADNKTGIGANSTVHNGKIDLGAYEYGSLSGMEELPQSGIAVSFRQAGDYLIASGLQSSETLRFYSLGGQLLFTRKTAGAPENIPIGHLPAGVYIVKVGNRAMKFVKNN